MKWIKQSLLLLMWWWTNAETTAQEAGQALSTGAVMTVPAPEVQLLSTDKYADAESYWQQRVNLHPLDEQAWLNLYKAMRYAQYTAHQRTISHARQKQLDELVTEIQAKIPGTFTAHYTAYLNGRKSQTAMSHLAAAYQVAPQQSELWDDVLCKAIIENNSALRKEMVNKLATSGQYSAAVMEYNRNVLHSVAQGGLLVTYGHVDTYPLHILQEKEKMRPDVKIICLEWLGNETYRKQVAAVTGLKDSQVSSDASATLAQIAGKSNKKIFLALTLPPAELKKYANSATITGLAMEHRATEGTTDVLVHNWEKNFGKQYLGAVDPLMRNYMVPLALLVKYYRSAGNTMREQEAEKWLKELAGRTDKPSVVLKYTD